MRKKNEVVNVFTRELANGKMSVCFNYRVNGVRHRENFKGVTLFARPKNLAEKYHNEKAQELIIARKAELTNKILTGAIETHLKSQRQKMRITDYITHYANTKKLSKNSKICFNTLVNSISAFDNAYVYEIDKDYILGYQQYLISSGCKNATTQRYIAGLKSVIKYALTEEYIMVNPFDKIPTNQLVKGVSGEREYLTAGEVARLANSQYASNYVIRAFLFSCFSGLRFGDVTTLTDKNFTKVGDEVICKGKAQKTGKAFEFAVSANAQRFLPSFPFYGYAFGSTPNNNANRIVNNAINALGINKKITFHCSRHTCATWLLSVGASIEVVQSVLGHSDVRTTQIYAKILDESKNNALKLLEI